jgi:ribonuclease BN (tRNA processing enzyme)
VKLTVVGSAGSFPGPDSAASCYLVEAEDDAGRTWRVVLDLGSGALGPLQAHLGGRPGGRAGHRALGDLDAVLLSHLHPDHCLDLCGFFVALRYAPDGAATRRVPVHGPAGTLRRLEEAYGSEHGEFAGVFTEHPWQDGEPVAIGPLTVTARRVEHPVEAYGVRVEHRQGHRTATLAYTGDTDTCAPLLELARGADLLLAEASFVEGRDTARGVHLTGRRAGEVAAHAGVRRLLLTHLPAWTPADVVLAEARDAYPGPVDLAAPGRVHVL